MAVAEQEISHEEESLQWEKDLDRVGVVRQMLRARKWYGADWWLITISLIMLAIFLLMAIVPSLFTRFDPRAEVGPALLAPGEVTQAQVIMVGENSAYETLRDFSEASDRIGVVQGSDAYKALDDATRLITEEDRAGGDEEANYTPRRVRFERIEEAVAALDRGEIDAIVEGSEILDPFLAENPQFVSRGALPGQVSESFVLGTNQIGHDVFSRLIYGARIALFVGLISALASLVIGVPLGLISGFLGGPLDRVLTLLMDSMYSFPGLILAIAISAVLGPGIINIIVAIAVLYIPTYFRIVRGQTLTVKEQLYVEAAKSMGASRFSMLRSYIFPNVIPSVVVIFSVNVADAILTEAGLSFLGLGLPPDTVDWGIDLARGQDRLLTSWWLITMPGVMVTLLVLSFSMLGESLSEILNPRLNQQ
jgi:peptide/nickel transport system permease protein